MEAVKKNNPNKKTIKKKQPVQPINHTSALLQHYQLLQEQFKQQNQEDTKFYV